MFTVAMLRARASRTAEQAGGFGDANAAQPEQSRSPTPVGRAGLPLVRRSRTVGGWWTCRTDDTAGSQAAAPKR